MVQSQSVTLYSGDLFCYFVFFSFLFGTQIISMSDYFRSLSFDIMLGESSWPYRYQWNDWQKTGWKLRLNTLSKRWSLYKVNNASMFNWKTTLTGYPKQSDANSDTNGGTGKLYMFEKWWYNPSQWHYTLVTCFAILYFYLVCSVHKWFQCLTISAVCHLT